MALFKRIAVAIDGSSVAKVALRESIKLAKDQQFALRIVFVVDVVPPSAESPYELTEYENASRRDGDRVLKQAAAVARKAGVEAEPVRLEVQSLRDRIANEIARNAKARRADLIVIGTHARMPRPESDVHRRRCGIFDLDRTGTCTADTGPPWSIRIELIMCARRSAAVCQRRTDTW
ncbi:universal stress protein [Rhodoferax sp. UBA5149]|uniref:universal stress protein n=1 Tax=Rhodoferax sp. UBA5149 TaxID=1947379 RepID=UPI0025CEDF38|nr:universal stress protein [Rhodoferax sp. UBA5149]